MKFIDPLCSKVQEVIQKLEHGHKTGSKYRHDLSHEQILRHAARTGFHVSRQYRQDTLRKKAIDLKNKGLLEGGRGKRYGDGHSFTITPLGKACLHALEQRRKKKDG